MTRAISNPFRLRCITPLLLCPCGWRFALSLAFILNNHRRGTTSYRTIFYVPSIVGGSIGVAVMWKEIFGNDGLVNFILAGLGIPTIAWLSDPRTAIWILILLSLWQFGSPMLIFLAGGQAPRGIS